MKLFRIVCAMALAGILAAAASAQEKAPAVEKQVQAESPAVAKERPMPGPMCGHEMMCRKMVPASDGGVFVLIGNRLMKYDANLTLQKEVEIKAGPDMPKKQKAEMQAKPKAAPEPPKAPEQKAPQQPPKQ